MNMKMGIGISALALAAGAFWARAHGRPSAPRPLPAKSKAPPPAASPWTLAPETQRQEVEACRGEIAALKSQLAALKKEDMLQRSVYEGLLAQAQKNLFTHPLAMSWQDFYRTSEAMHVDEDTLIQNIILRLQKEVGLSEGQCRDLLDLLSEERRDLRRRFQARYAAQIEGEMLDSLPQEACQRMVMDIAAFRQEIRKDHEGRYQTLFPEVQLAAIRRHLRNDFTVAYTSDGGVLGGVGVPESQLP